MWPRPEWGRDKRGSGSDDPEEADGGRPSVAAGIRCRASRSEVRPAGACGDRSGLQTREGAVAEGPAAEAGHGSEALGLEGGPGD
ncbi:hypothetical protein NDU88_005166 [Pleurodeles waltl]|uniref:Uncharacterized protein n=1 Tax=Pleurodeles waltl TaxID=8319 RepID=A0AAV7MZP3_PLEWA|nr:hypothetical protein NDU88_005166 [Pleurodeles waltl]